MNKCILITGASSDIGRSIALKLSECKSTIGLHYHCHCEAVATLQEQLADRYGLHVTVCHYPTGASKWNPVEHRLFAPVSINWAGQPLRSLEILLDSTSVPSLRSARMFSLDQAARCLVL